MSPFRKDLINTSLYGCCTSYLNRRDLCKKLIKDLSTLSKNMSDKKEIFFPTVHFVSGAKDPMADNNALNKIVKILAFLTQVKITYFKNGAHIIMASGPNEFLRLMGIIEESVHELSKH